jgi:hypothetical protein
MERFDGTREGVAASDQGEGAPTVDPRERAILRTVTYAALFQFLALPQLHRRLMGVPLTWPGRRLLERPFLRSRSR